MAINPMTDVFLFHDSPLSFSSWKSKQRGALAFVALNRIQKKKLVKSNIHLQKCAKHLIYSFTKHMCT